MKLLDQHKASLAAWVLNASHTAPWPPYLPPSIHPSMCNVKFSIRIPCMLQRALSNPRVHFIWHVMHYLVTFPSWGLRRSHPSLENSNGTACYDSLQCTHFPSAAAAGTLSSNLLAALSPKWASHISHTRAKPTSHINRAIFAVISHRGHMDVLSE